MQIVRLSWRYSKAEAGQAHIPFTGRGSWCLIKAFAYTSIYQASLEEVNGSKRSINQFAHPKHMPPWKRAQHKAVFKLGHCLLRCQPTVVVFGSRSAQRASAEQISPQQNDFLVQREYDRARDKNNFCCLRNWAKWAFVLRVISWHKEIVFPLHRKCLSSQLAEE